MRVASGVVIRIIGVKNVRRRIVCAIGVGWWDTLKRRATARRTVWQRGGIQDFWDVVEEVAYPEEEAEVGEVQDSVKGMLTMGRMNRGTMKH